MSDEGLRITQYQSEVLVRVLSDLPVGGGDGVAFQFEPIARTLAEVAWNGANQTPFTVVIRGEWGRGKTTLMRQIERQFALERAAPVTGRRKVDSVWLNVWKYPDEEKVLAGLLGKLIASFETGGMLDQLKIKVDEYKEGLARSILHAAAPWLFGGDVKGRYDAVYERRAFLDVFDFLFRHLLLLRRNGWEQVKKLKDGDLSAELDKQQHTHALAVFLDDLDRCSQDRVVEVLEAIYRFQDMPGVCFYLGLDWRRLASVLKERLPEHEEAFLEKIVQLAYDLPPVSRDGATEFIDSLVTRCGLDAALDSETGASLRHLATSLQTHPRHLKRFLNDFSLRLGVLRNTGLLTGGATEEAGQVSARQLLAVHALGWVLTGEDASIVKDALQLRDLLTDCAAIAGDQRPDKISEGVFTLFQQQRWLFEALNEIAEDRGKLGTLVHHGSPSPPSRPVNEEAGAERESVGGVSRTLSGDSVEWVPLAGGRLVMGDQSVEREAPEHMVTLRPFEISKFPITNAQYARYVKETSAKAPEHWEQGEVPADLANHPVVNVSWQDADGYCRWLTEAVKTQRGTQSLLVTLPAEAQWEFAARGGETRRTYPWGEAEPTDELANFGDPKRGTTSVDRYRRGATAEGVWDMAGNVWEWCQDDWHANYTGAPVDGSPWIDEPRRPSRVLRGGSFVIVPRYLRAAYRVLDLPDYRYGNIGFRVVCGSGG